MLTPAEQLRSLRDRLGIRQGELARASGLTRQAIYLIERGLRQPTKATLRAIELALGSLWLDQAQAAYARAGDNLTDDESRANSRSLQLLDIDELLEVKVRLTPRIRDENGDHQLDGANSQVVDGLQARPILRLFGELFKVDLLPGWWTVRDDMRVLNLWYDHKNQSYEQMQQRIIQEGPGQP